MNTALADGNVLVALTVADHVHHHQARAWFEAHQGRLATCPITQGTLLRFLLRQGVATSEAVATLGQVEALPQHVFWPDEIGYDASIMAGVIGHRQATDAYLTALASYFGGSLATFDKGLASLATLHDKTVELIPT